MKPPPAWETGEGAPRKKSNLVLWILLGVFGGGCVLCVPIIAAVLFPAFAQARNVAKNRECLLNLRRDATAMLLYSNDNDDRLPLKGNWVDSISAYSRTPSSFLRRQGRIDRSFTCPGLRRDQFGYAMGSKLSGAKLSKLENKGQLPLIFDSVQTQKNASSPEPDFPSPSRHAGKNNVAFVDGHVVSIPSGSASPAPK